MRRVLTAAFLGIVFLAIASTPSVSKGFFEELWEIGTDPLKLRASSNTLYETAERSFIQLNALEEKANYDATQRINQIGEIIKTVTLAMDRNVANLKQIIDDAINKLNDLESKLNADANRFIYKVQCIPQNAVQDLREGYKKLVSDIIASDPRVEIPISEFPGLKFFTDKEKISAAELKLTKIDVPDPDIAYFESRDAVLSALEKKVRDENTDAYAILSTYQNLQRQAKNTACLFIDQPLALRFIKEQTEFERLSWPWVTVVEPIR